MSSGNALPWPKPIDQSGYAYILLLVIVTSITTLASYSLEWGASSHRREAERELLRIGAEFEKAFVSYAATSRQTDPVLAGPTDLDQLLKDNRQPQALRHLRKMYKDPLTGEQTWGTVRGPNGTLWGVYSLASGTPLQQKRFDRPWAHLEDAQSYSDWVFGLPQARSLQRPDANPAAPKGRPTAPPPSTNNPFSGAPS